MEEPLMKRIHIVAFLALLLTALVVGCESNDERLVQATREADQRQAEQNHAMAKQNHEIAQATKQLVAADAESRKELVKMERDLQAERSAVGAQRDMLESERREIAEARQRDPLIAEALTGACMLLACVLPLLLVGYLLYSLNRKSDDDSTLVDLLAMELVTETPLLLPNEAPTGGNRLPAPESGSTAEKLDGAPPT
jgi:hypothetical protein